jgi:hypothetical protein
MRSCGSYRQPFDLSTDYDEAMTIKFDLSLLATFVGFACSTFAQSDAAGFASELRAKYGPSLHRETFMARPDLEMVVDFAANGHVCAIQLPPMALGREPGVKTAQAVRDFLAELVPSTMRGRELRRMIEAMGAPSVSIVEYENVTISESWQGERLTLGLYLE